MYDDFGGPGFDWNGNGKQDLFDDYMNMKAAGSSGSHNKTCSRIADSENDKWVVYDSRKDSDGVAVFKLLLVCVFCIGGLLLPASANAGPVGMAIGMLGALALSFATLKL